MNVFISHATTDGTLARQLAHRLSKRGFQAVLPATEVLPGQNWARAVADALDRADAMVVLLSPESAKSPWLRHEIDYALGHERFEGRLIPVLAHPTTDYPWILDRMPMLRAESSPAATAAKVIEALEKPLVRAA